MTYRNTLNLKMKFLPASSPSSVQRKTYALDLPRFSRIFRARTCTRSPFVRRGIGRCSHFVPLSVHVACTKKRPPMASINKPASGKWRVQVRTKGHYLSNGFSLPKDAEMWARRIEREIDLSQKPAPSTRTASRLSPTSSTCISRIWSRLARKSVARSDSVSTCSDQSSAT